jgi:hypothetical protein
MAFRANGVTADPTKHALMVAMLREQRADWTPAKVAYLIVGELDPSPIVEHIAAYVKDRPALWNVSDAELLRAVRDVDPLSADLLDTREGLAFLHRMSGRLAWATGGKLVRSMLGLP